MLSSSLRFMRDSDIFSKFSDSPQVISWFMSSCLHIIFTIFYNLILGAAPLLCMCGTGFGKRVEMKEEKHSGCRKFV